MSSPTLTDETITRQHVADTRQQMAREIVRRQGLLATPQRKIIAALVMSLVAPLIFGSFLEQELPDEKIVPLQAKFVKLPPPPSAQTSVAAAKPKPKPRPKPQPNAAVAALPSTEPVVAQNEPVVEKAPEPTPEPKQEEPAVEKIAEVVPEKKAEEPAPLAPPAIDPSKLPPKKIQLGYTA
ncbi:MAG: hypothetical protein ACRDAM_01090, partial [Casimicrobium sp.]